MRNRGGCPRPGTAAPPPSAVLPQLEGALNRQLIQLLHFPLPQAPAKSACVGSRLRRILGSRDGHSALADQPIQRYLAGWVGDALLGGQLGQWRLQQCGALGKPERVQHGLGSAKGPGGGHAAVRQGQAATICGPCNTAPSRKPVPCSRRHLSPGARRRPTCAGVLPPCACPSCSSRSTMGCMRSKL